MKNFLLSFETSCDDTCVGIIDNEFNVVSNIVYNQNLIHSKFNGIVPEIAFKYHNNKIFEVLKFSLEKKKINLDSIFAVSATIGPGLFNSLLIGYSYAKFISSIKSIPFIGINHLEGHIFSSIKNTINFPFIALIISGGNTVLYLCEKKFEYKQIGITRDDAVGEAFDKIASMLGLKYPGGISINNLLNDVNNLKDYKFPISMKDKNNYDFSFSGIKTSVKNFIKNKALNNLYELKSICFSIQKSIFFSIIEKTINSCKQLCINNLYIGGGVSANKYFRNEIKRKCFFNNINISLPDLEYCTDNAIMIAKAALFRYKNNKNINDIFSNINSNLLL